ILRAASIADGPVSMQGQPGLFIFAQLAYHRRSIVVVVEGPMMNVRLVGLLLASLGFAGLASSVSGQTKHDPETLKQALRDVINTGADLFNLQADYAGCYHVYQWSLVTLKPFLGPSQRKEIDEAL